MPANPVRGLWLAEVGALKMLDVKMTDQMTGHENAGREIAGHEIAGQKEQDMKLNQNQKWFNKDATYVHQHNNSYTE